MFGSLLFSLILGCGDSKNTDTGSDNTDTATDTDTEETDTEETDTEETDTEDTGEDTGSEEIALPAGLNFVLMHRGTFTMGSNDGGGVTGPTPEDAAEHSVTLSDFEMGETEVTNAQYLEFLQAAWDEGLLRVEHITETWPDGSIQSHDWVFGVGDGFFLDKPLIELSPEGGVSSEGDVEHDDNRSWIVYDLENGFSLADEAKADWPVNWVKWYGAKAFAEFYGLSLPTEAEWEYSARCMLNGSEHTANFATASGTAAESEANWNGDVPNVANHEGTLVAVKTYAPNPCGLYEMSGNAWEWVADWYGGNTYYQETDGETDPVNMHGEDPEEAIGSAEYEEGTVSNFRVRRGGSWNYHTQTITTWARAYDFPQRGNNHFGFRVVRRAY